MASVALMFGPIVELHSLAVDRYRRIAGGEQLLAIRRNAIQCRPGRLVPGNSFEIVVGNQWLFPSGKTGSLRCRFA